MFASSQQFAGECEFEIGFESQKKVTKSAPWTVSVSLFVKCSGNIVEEAWSFDK